MLISQENISKLYLAVFGRPLDSAGLAYWTSTGEYLNSGSPIKTIEELSQNFALQEEYLLKYPSTTTDTEFINSIYQNLFQRDAEAGGLEYWLEELSSGAMTRDKAILTIMNGAQDNDLKLITDRSQKALSLALENDLTSDVAKSQQLIDSIMLSTTNDSLGTLSDIYTDGVYEVSSFTTWDDSLDAITFSFNSTIPSDYYEYTENSKEILVDGFVELSTQQKDATRDIVENLNEFLGVPLQEVSSDGMIRFSIINMDSGTAGFAFLPGDYYSFYGDVFLSTGFNTQQIILA